MGAGPDPFLLALGEAMAQSCGVPPGTGVVVAVSGGVDSVSLARGLHALGYRLVLAHANHALRGEASDADEAFVRDLAGSLGVPFERASLPPGEGNRQAEARRARYAWLSRVSRDRGEAVIATGHTATDQAETVLLHLIRGTGLRGLGGMAWSRAVERGRPERLVRPLLGLARAEIEAAALRHGWAWRDDASNAGASYRRNRIRQNVLPLLEAEGGPGVALRIAQAAAAVRGALAASLLEGGGEGEALGGEGARPLAEGGGEGREGGALRLETLRGLSPDARHALYFDVLARHVPEAPRRKSVAARLDALLGAQPGRRVPLGGGVEAWRERDRITLVRTEAPLAPVEVRVGAPAETPLGTFLAEALPSVPTDPQGTSPFAETVDADALRAPLVLRPWQAGDRFRPLGLEGSRRVSDVLTDLKVRPSERARQLVLTAGGETVWLVGHRLDERARVGPETRRALRLTWTSRAAASSEV